MLMVATMTIVMVVAVRAIMMVMVWVDDNLEWEW